MKRFVSIERAILVGVVVVQAATIAYLFRASAHDRYEKKMLLGRIERYEDALQNSPSQPAARLESLAADSGQTPALPFFRAHAEMEKILSSMFGASGDTSENFPPESSHDPFSWSCEDSGGKFSLVSPLAPNMDDRIFSISA